MMKSVVRMVVKVMIKEVMKVVRMLVWWKIDFILFEGFFFLTDRLSNERTDVGDCRDAFATKNFVVILIITFASF